jgi:hypothetical protein
MKIVNERPPIWADVKRLFDFNEKTTVFTYGDTIYNPAGGNVSADIVAHESVHMAQQAAMNVWGHCGAWLWWKKYLRDPQFRLEQETEAYRYQYQFAVQQIKSREKLAEYLFFLASQLSDTMYGRIIGFNEAMRMIRLSPAHKDAEIPR